MTILAMNLEKLLQLLYVLFAFWLQILSSQFGALRGNRLPSSVQAAAA
jgi:hypothetical protein